MHRAEKEIRRTRLELVGGGGGRIGWMAPRGVGISGKIDRRWVGLLLVNGDQ